MTTPMTAPLPGDPNFLPRRVRRIFQVGRVQPNPTQPPPPPSWGPSAHFYWGGSRIKARRHPPRDPFQSSSICTRLVCCGPVCVDSATKELYAIHFFKKNGL